MLVVFRACVDFEVVCLRVVCFVWAWSIPLTTVV